MTLKLRPEPGFENRYQVYSGRVQIGTVYLAVNVTKPSPNWFWTISGVSNGTPGMRFSGYVNSLEEAKATIKDHWLSWAAAAGLAPIPGGA